MVKFYPSLTENHVAFINAQPLFFVASAPWAGTHINVSPKGHPSRTFSVLGPNTIAYLDATGSGCETISHVYENGRVTVMFCSFGAQPQTMRLFCSGRVVEKWDQHFQELRARMATENGDEVDITGARAIIVLRVKKVQISGGLGVPQIAIKKSAEVGANGYEEANIHSEVEEDVDQPFAPRDNIDSWARKQLERKELLDYQKAMNHRSLDGLPGMLSARRALDQNMAIEDARAWLRKIRRQQDAILFGAILGVLLMIFLSLIGFIRISPSFIDHILNYQKQRMGITTNPSSKDEL